MALLEDVSTRLADQGVVGGATGWTVVRDAMPSGPDQVVVVTETPGEAPGTRTEIDRPHLQARTRGAEDAGRSAARSKAGDVYDALHGFTGTIDGTYYIGIYAMQTPFFLRVDENDRYEYGVNFRILRSR
ncbi:MAG: minor capsid protein [Gemmatimonadota bacterium]